MQRWNENEMETPGEFKLAQPRKQTGRLQDELVTEVSGDRRSRRRYPLGLQVMYKVVKKYQVCLTGMGKTIDMSGSGILFETEDPLEPGSIVELAIAWPVLLNKTCSLKLIVTGRVVRSGRAQAAIRMQGYEFRTKGAGALQTMTASSHFC
jgi:hypothetical protein